MRGSVRCYNPSLKGNIYIHIYILIYNLLDLISVKATCFYGKAGREQHVPDPTPHPDPAPQPQAGPHQHPGWKSKGKIKNGCVLIKSGCIFCKEPPALARMCTFSHAPAVGLLL